MSFTYDFPRPGLTVDTAVFGYQNGVLQILLMKRSKDPFKDCWALPGGFVHDAENIEEAAKRTLKEKCDIGQMYLEQLYTFGDKNRDPRDRIISVAYFALVKPEDYKPMAKLDTKDVEWFPVHKLPKLAFDHKTILGVALTRVRNKVRYEPIAFALLPAEFTLSQLQDLYEAIFGQEIDKRNFRKKVLSLGILKATKKKSMQGAHRPSELFRFDQKAYTKLFKNGLNFSI